MNDITIEHPLLSLRSYAPGDAPLLFAITPGDTFENFLTSPAQWNLSAFTTWVQQAAAKRPTLVARLPTGEVVGSSSYLEVDAHHDFMEIGATWYAPRYRGTFVNPLCKLLMLTLAFEGPGEPPLGACKRVQLKCDERNVRSQAAIAKLGAKREGVLRNHKKRPDGSLRNTVMFSIVPEEWPMVKQRLEERVRECAG